MALVNALSAGASRVAISSSRASAKRCVPKVLANVHTRLSHQAAGLSACAVDVRSTLTGRKKRLGRTIRNIPSSSVGRMYQCRPLVVASKASTLNGEGGQEPVYVTTPIYYVNDKPHIGHVYTSTLSDAYARYHRLQGKEVHFLTGTDEHGLKVEQSAQKRGTEPQLLADENSAAFRQTMEEFGISFDQFIRTTDDHHKQQVSAYVERLMESGMIYLGTFEGWYDEGQEEYHTETQAKELDYKSPINGKPLVKSSEENYYFKLSAFQERLEALYAENPHLLQPESRQNEMLNRLKGGLQDVPISRTNFSWGIPMPGDEKHVIYVWIDALFNYITAVGLANEGDALHKFWPANIHVMAKEIVWFHSIIWPAVLMALDLPLPRKVYAHGFWVRNGKKMSKSLGNFVDIDSLGKYKEMYGLDGLRYYLVTQGPIGMNDANFSDYSLFNTYNVNLVNTLGNCAARTTAMINKYYKGDDAGVPSEFDENGNRIEIEGFDWPTITAEATKKVEDAMEEFDLPAAANAAIGVIEQVDVFIAEREPFKLAKDETKRAELGAILYQSIEALRIGAALLEPIMPEKTAQLAEAIGTADMAGTLSERAKWGLITPGQQVNKVALFPRVDMPEAATKEYESTLTVAS